MLVLDLPIPPSVNRYWRYNPKSGKAYVTPHGRAYRATVVEKATRMRSEGRLPAVALSGPLRVGVVLCPPDARTRDLDNVLKALLDAITHAGVWRDDGEIDDLRIVRGDPAPGGAVVVTAERIGLMTARAA
jgi:crossover junction endodeoxyribonuclease RusA